ncbi:MAG: ATP synthase F0 subunit B [Deltaproteobacteria bacterium]|jgi:F-type H+-transporting ATPase subunit b|nr:ATP synthase F0 subunit B [Deltaproteobacteria bacterium]
MFDINITLLIQLVNFIVTLAALDFLLIRPIRGIVKKRRDLASGMLAETERFTAEAAGKLEGYETALGKAREEAAAIREARKNEGAATEAELLAAAAREAQEFLRESRASTRAQVAGTMADMERRLPELAAMAAARLLGKDGAQPPAA